MILIRLNVEWGHGSDTYDFDSAYVTVDSRRRVVIHHWKFFGWLHWKLKDIPKEKIYIGHSYQARDRYDRILMRLELVPTESAA
jgi:hypothetical protein